MLLPRKPQDFAEDLCFSICLFPLHWNSDSTNSFATCLYVGEPFCHSLGINFSLVMSSSGGPGKVKG